MRDKSTREIIAELVEPDQLRIVAGAIGYFEDEKFKGEDEFSENIIKDYCQQVLSFIEENKTFLADFNLFDRYKLIKKVLNKEDYPAYMEQLKNSL